MKAFAVAGLGFGDEGKGTTVDALVEKFQAGLVVRYNGGAQAAHNVVRKGVHHTFAQFGSGTLAKARTHLSRFMVVNPIAFFKEADHLEKQCSIAAPHQLVTVSPHALVTTPFHIAMNRLREQLRGENAHGTTGMGVGETYELSRDDEDLAMRVGDLYSFERRKRLQAIRDHYMDQIRDLKVPEHEVPLAFTDQRALDVMVEIYQKFAEHVVLVGDDKLERLMSRAGVTVFEGAQGILLDQLHGFHPYSTWSDCTFDHVLDLIDDFDVDLCRLAVTRSYHTRHGNGPFPTEAKGFDDLVWDDHNTVPGGFQGKFRAGPFDLVLAKYGAAFLRGAGGLVMTHLDKIPKHTVGYAESYLLPGADREAFQIYDKDPKHITELLKGAEPTYKRTDSKEFPRLIASLLRLPLVMTSSGVEATDKQFLGEFFPESP